MDVPHDDPKVVSKPMDQLKDWVVVLTTTAKLYVDERVSAFINVLNTL